MFQVRTKAASAELGHDVFQTSQALKSPKKENKKRKALQMCTHLTNWGKHKTYEHKELLPAFAVEGLLPYKQSSFDPVCHCFDSNHTSQLVKGPDSWFTFFHYVILNYYVTSCVQLRKNTSIVFMNCSSGLPVAKAATVRRKKSMELEASWSSHIFWALPMGFPSKFDGSSSGRCHCILE